MGQSSYNNTTNNLFIKIIEGQTQSHQLFDFQNGGQPVEQTHINSPSFIIDNGEGLRYCVGEDEQKAEINNNNQEEIILIESQRSNKKLYQLTLDQNNDKQIIIKDLLSLQKKQRKILWRVIQQNQAFPLKTGDVIKIGKIKIQLKKIVRGKADQNLEQVTLKDQDQMNNNENHGQNIHNPFNNQPSHQQVVSMQSSAISSNANCSRCRICFSSSNHKNDPLVCLCSCSGSIKYVHFICLKDWIQNNISKREDQKYKFYSYNEISCELCKSKIKEKFTHEGKDYELCDFGRMEVPYAEFEHVQTENGKKRYYKYFIKLGEGGNVNGNNNNDKKDKQIVIGRNNSSQVVMKDISISRTHCSIEYKNGVLLLRDKMSKFGTLVKVEDQIEFNAETGVQLQYESKIIEIYQKKAFSINLGFTSVNSLCCEAQGIYRIKFQRGPDEEQAKEESQKIEPQVLIQQNHHLPHLQHLSNPHNFNNNPHNLIPIHSGLLREIPSEPSEQQHQASQFINSSSARNTMIRQTQIMDEVRYY